MSQDCGIFSLFLEISKDAQIKLEVINKVIKEKREDFNIKQDFIFFENQPFLSLPSLTNNLILKLEIIRDELINDSKNIQFFSLMCDLAKQDKLSIERQRILMIQLLTELLLNNLWNIDFNFEKDIKVFYETRLSEIEFDLDYKNSL